MASFSLNLRISQKVYPPPGLSSLPKPKILNAGATFLDPNASCK